MAHELSFIGSETGDMVYNSDEGAPWHKYGTPIGKGCSLDDALDKAHMRFKVAPRNLYLPSGAVVPDRKANMRINADGSEIYLGTVGNRYKAIQNSEAAEFLKTLFNVESEAYVQTAGVLQDGRKIWFMLNLPGNFFVGEKDEISKRVLLTNSHDGTYALRCFITPVRVVCMNTLSVAMRRGDKEGISVRHTANSGVRLEEAQRILGVADQSYAAIETAFNRMAEFAFSEEDAANYFERLVPDTENAKFTTRTENIREKMMENFFHGRGSNLSRGTLWGAYNAVTEYTDHTFWDTKDLTKRTKQTNINDDRLKSIWFERGANLKYEAMETAQEIMEGNTSNMLISSN